MGAEFFSVEPLPTPAARTQRTGTGPRLRQIHRWVSIAFTLTVTANFTAMIWGQPPAWITYSPLPPLLILLLTGLCLLGRHHFRTWRAPVPVQSNG